MKEIFLFTLNTLEIVEALSSNLLAGKLAVDWSGGRPIAREIKVRPTNSHSALSRFVLFTIHARKANLVLS